MQHRITLLALATLATAPAAIAQSGQINVGDAHSILVTSRTTGSTFNDPTFFPANNEFTGQANLNLNVNTGGTRGCTGSLLWTGRHILTAAHCVSTSTTNITTNSGIVRLRDGSGGFNTYSWSNASQVAVRGGYSGAVVEEQDVAVITLDQTASSVHQRYFIHEGDATNHRTVLAGYGRTGTGLTGDGTATTQFTATPQIRRGWNRFDTTCTEAAGPSPIFATCANNANANKGAFGGILMMDFDEPGTSNTADLCTSLQICLGGESGGAMGQFDETGVGRGDSGGAAFNEANGRILGVASWGVGNGVNLSQFGRVNGYACVANYAANAACQANYNFIVSIVGQPTVVIPEPSTYALMATGLAAMGLVARRRRSAK